MRNSRTYYSASPFGDGGYSNALVQAPTLGRARVIPLSPTRMILPYRAPAQRHGMGVLHDEIGDLISGATGIVDGLIGALPLNLAGNFEARRDACLDKPVWKRYDCLIKLTRDVRDAIKDDEDEPPPATPTNGGTQNDPPSEFPWVPVGIGAVAVLAIGYAIVTKGK